LLHCYIAKYKKQDTRYKQIKNPKSKFQIPNVKSMTKSKIQNDTKCHPGASHLLFLSSWKERAKRATDRGCHPGTKRTKWAKW